MQSKINFFITGLPRSGTAWASNFLTWKDSTCYHELLYQIEDISIYNEILDSSSGRFTGDSDTMLVYLLPWIKKEYPDSKFIFIKRDVEEVRKSLKNNGFSTLNLDELNRQLEWNIEHIDGMVIDFKDLFEDFERVWNYIGIPSFPHERHDMLKTTRIDNAINFMDAEYSSYQPIINSIEERI